MKYATMVEVIQLDDWRSVDDKALDEYHTDLIRWKKYHADTHDGEDYDPAYYLDIKSHREDEIIPDGWIIVSEYAELDTAFSMLSLYIPLVVDSRFAIDGYIRHAFYGE